MQYLEEKILKSANLSKHGVFLRLNYNNNYFTCEKMSHNGPKKQNCCKTSQNYQVFTFVQRKKQIIDQNVKSKPENIAHWSKSIKIIIK